MTNSPNSSPELTEVERRQPPAIARLMLELRLSMNVFRDYGYQHQDKAEACTGRERDDRLRKAKRNFERASAIEAALDDFQALSSKNELPSRVAMFLEILSAAGGAADASDNPWNWINAFCEGHEGRDPDTFNQAIDLGFVSWSHDSDSDNSTITLTEMGRAALNPKDTGQ
jgi:hypothetical protein